MHQLRLKKTGTQTIDLRKASSIATYPRHNKQRKTRTTEEGRAEARGESGGHLDVIRLLDLGGGGVDADPQDIVVSAVLHHGRQLLSWFSPAAALEATGTKRRSLMPAAMEEAGA